MCKSLISTILTIYVMIFIVISHALLMACKQAQIDQSSLHDELAPIAAQLPTSCPQFPDFIFSISDFLLVTNPKIAEEFLRHAISGFSGVRCMVDVVLFSGYVLTYAENIAFYFYMVYLPLKLFKKGVDLALKVFVVTGLVFLLFELKMLISEQVFENSEADFVAEKWVIVGKKMLA